VVGVAERHDPRSERDPVDERIIGPKFLGEYSPGPGVG
jgi:hypothetical protein